MQVWTRLATVALVATSALIPGVMWLGFADNVSVPKTLVLNSLVLVMAILILVRDDLRVRLAASALTIPLVVLAGSAALSCGLSGAPVVSWAGEGGSWMGASQTGSFALAALVAVVLMSGVSVRKVMTGVLVSASLLLAYALVQRLQLDPFPWNPALKSGYWLFASLGNPVHLGNFLACAFWVSFAVFPRGGVPVWLFRAALVAGVAATQERSALLALAVALVVATAQAFVPVVREREWRWRSFLSSRGLRRCGLAALVCVVVATGVTLLPGPGSERHDRIGSLVRLTGARPEIWKAAGRLLIADPWFGIGPDMFHSRFLSVAAYEYFVAEPPSIAGDSVHLRLPASAHNEPVSFAVAQGLVGFGVYVWVLLVAFRAGRMSPLLPALTSCWVVHLANPASTATASLFWVLLAAVSVERGIARAGRGSGAYGGGWVAGGCAVLFLISSLVTSLRTCVVQAHRREVSRLAFFGQELDLRYHLDRWSAYAARMHPQQAHEDASLLRTRWTASTAASAASSGAVAERALALWMQARRANPYSVFYLSAQSDFEVALGRRHADVEAMKRGEVLIREALVIAPAALSLHDDLAEALTAQGRIGAADRCRSLRDRLDPEGLFAAKGL